MELVQNLIAVTESVETAGAVIWWRLGGPVGINVLSHAWVERGLNQADLPETPTDKTALRRAVQEETSKHVLARPTGQGWALVRELVEGDDLSYTVENRFETLGESVLAAKPDETAERVTTAYRRHLSALSQQDVSGWLVQTANRFRALRLRDTGGIYFVPRSSLDDWRKLASALHAASEHKIFELPALKTSEAIDAIVDALKRETEALATEIREDIAEGGLGERALQGRKDRCDHQLEKVRHYEALLGRKLADIENGLEQMKASVAMAALAAEPDLI